MADDFVADPDAMWKPGCDAPGSADAGGSPEPDDAPPEWFAGYERTVGLAAEPPEPTTAPPVPPGLATGVADGPLGPRAGATRRWIVGGLAIAIVVVGGVVWQIAGGDEVENDHRLASIPAGATPAWTTVLETGGVNGVIGTQSTVVVLESVTNDLVGLTASSGVERWRVNTAPSNSIATLERSGGAAIVLVERNTGDRSIAAYDVESGVRLWRENGYDRALFTVFLGSVYRLPRGETDVVVERLDPRTGTGLNALGSQVVNFGWTHVSTTRNELVEVFDLQTLERVAGPVIDGDMVAATVVDGRVVGLDGDATLRVLGSTGVELSSLKTSIDQPDLFDVTNTSEPMLLVHAEREIVGYSLTGDRIARAWWMGSVQVNEITDVGDHTYAIVQPVVAAGPNGGPVSVVDAATGDVVAQPSDGSWVRLGSDGFVVEITDDEGVRDAIEAYGYDGERRWRFDLTRKQQDVFLVDGAIVVVASDYVDDASTLTYVK